ncbi:MAG TPA: ATP-binding protein [Thermoanaerobaculia bacterium]|nr:ATP-binding protein [Thermoanaerobaculia bacterium]
MLAAPVPANEAERLRALDRYAILDTLPEPGFEDVARLASMICGTPIALISLVDDHRQWFKARVGLNVAETPRDLAFCAHALNARELLIVPDARIDVRFADNPLVVAEPRIRFYAGAPLTTPEGLNLGTLCVIDHTPRTLSDEQHGALRALAGQVMVQLELRRQIAEREALATRRQRAEQALRESEARLRAIIDSSLGGLVTTDSRGIIESCNPAAERIFGYAAEELIGQSSSVLLAQRFPSDGDYLRHLRGNAVGRVTEVMGRRSNGETFPCELSLFEFTIGEERHFAGHMLDVSERHAVDRMKKDFVATVSHELRTPLTSIRGSLGLLASGVMGELAPEAKQLVEVAERNGIRLITLINDILDFEKLENGKLELEFSAAPLTRILERSIEAIASVACEEGVRIALQSEDGAVFGDEARLIQVMVNLLSNAVKFSPRGAVITVAATIENGWANIAVTDRGRGIPPERQRLLFQRFQQIDSSDSRTKGGTGLGLAICKAIVEQHGGTISCASTPDEGTTFSFRVPMIEAVAGDVRRIVISVGDRNIGVSDTVKNGALLHTESAEDALRLLRVHPAELIVVDGSGGCAEAAEFLDGLAGDPQLRELPVVVAGANVRLAPERLPRRISIVLDPSDRFSMTAACSAILAQSIRSELLPER